MRATGHDAPRSPEESDVIAGEHTDAEVAGVELVVVIPVSSAGDEILLFPRLDNGAWLWAVPSGQGALSEDGTAKTAAGIEFQHDLHVPSFVLSEPRMKGTTAIYRVTLSRDAPLLPKKEGRPLPQWFSVTELPPIDAFFADQGEIIYEQFGLESAVSGGGSDA